MVTKATAAAVWAGLEAGQRHQVRTEHNCSVYTHNRFAAGAASNMTSAQRKEAEANGSSQGAQVCIVFPLLDMYFECILPGPERLL